MGTAISPASTLPPLLSPEQAVPVEQPDRKTPASHSQYFMNGFHFVRNEAERGNRNDHIEGSISKRKRSCIGDCIG
jgi:hypothetical protein